MSRTVEAAAARNEEKKEAKGFMTATGLSVSPTVLAGLSWASPPALVGDVHKALSEACRTPIWKP